MSKFHTHTQNIHQDVKLPYFRPINKQLITEEKIAAHLSRLHISGTPAQKPSLPNSSPEPPISTPQSEKISENVLMLSNLNIFLTVECAMHCLGLLELSNFVYL